MKDEAIQLHSWPPRLPRPPHVRLQRRQHRKLLQGSGFGWHIDHA